MADCCNSITLEGAIELLKEYQGVMHGSSDKISLFVNGGPTQTVSLGGVATPTLRNLAREVVESYIRLATKERLGVVQIGNGLYVTEKGLLSLDVLTGTGLTFNTETGALEIDFSDMPVERFEAMLKALRLPQWLTANKTWYVRPDGNNKNTGDSNTSTGAFKTIQAAVNYVATNFNVANFTGTISIAAGTYAETIHLVGYAGSTGHLRLFGDDNGGTIVSRTGGTVIEGTSAGTWYLEKMTVQNDSSPTINSAIGVAANSATLIYMTDIKVHVVNNGASTGIVACVSASGGTLWFLSNCEFNMAVGATPFGANSLIYCTHSGVVQHGDANLVLNGSTANAVRVTNLGAYNRRNSAALVSGTVVGRRYYATLNGIINVSGGGANFFPGSTAGVIESGGQYA